MANKNEVAESLKIGDKVGEIEIQITDEMIDSYAAALEDSDPFFLKRNSSGRRIAYPELLPKYAMEKLWEEPLFNRMPNIRAKQAYTFFEPVMVGVKYRATGYVKEKYEKRGKLFIVFEATFTDEDGKEVLKDKRTQLILPEGFKIGS